MSKYDSDIDPLKQVMETVVAGFQKTTEAIQNLRDAYQGMTGSGKSRYVSELVKIEEQNEQRGAKARVAETLDLSPGRITQLLNSEKNRKNGK